MTQVPCMNPAHGVGFHVLGSESARECAADARSRGAGATAVPGASLTVADVADTDPMQVQRDWTFDLITGKMDESYDLDYVDYRSELTDEQFAAFFEGGDAVDGALGEIEENWYESRYAASKEVVGQLVNDSYDDIAERFDFDPDEYDYEAFLDDHPELADELRLAVEDRNSSNIWRELARRTPNKLVRYSFGHEVPDTSLMSAADRYREIDEVIRITGIPDTAENRAAVDGVLVEASYGGDLQLIWSADVSDITNNGRFEPPTDVTMKDPTILVFNSWNGSGMDGKVQGDVSIALDGGDNAIMPDGKHGWDNVAGVVTSAYEPASVEYAFRAPDVHREQPEGVAPRRADRIVDERYDGVGCNQDESAVLKRHVRERGPDNALSRQIARTFPVEYGEAVSGR